MSSVRKSLGAAAEKGCTGTSEGVRLLPTMFSLDCSWEGKWDSQRAAFFFFSKQQFSTESPLMGNEWKLQVTETWPCFIVCGMIS